MATKKSKPQPKTKSKVKVQRVEQPVKAEMPAWLKEKPEASMTGEELDPQEEKVLDWILKGVVGFVLVWLGISILMVIGGYFHLWG